MSQRGRLTRSFFEAPTLELAQALIGCCLVHRTTAGTTVGRIVETEAYLAQADPASHSFRGETPRNRSMFKRPGSAYVYLIYGMHLCLNVVSAAEGVGEAVLVRALEPIEGLPLMTARRGGVVPKQLCNGPAKLAQAMGVERAHDGADLCRGALGLWRPESCGEWNASEVEIVASPRIGITRGAELPWRFSLASSRWLSRPTS